MIHPMIRQHDVQANGITIHLAEAGEGPVVLLCHGFPESWYSWRHQMVALAKAGFRAIAPDMRGYGGTSAPDDIGDYSMFHLTGDMVGLLDALDIESAVIVGHDWGAPVAWNSALLRPDRFHAVAGLSVPFMPRGPMSGLEMARRAGRHDFYQLYFQEPGKAEAEFNRDVAATMRRILWTLSAGPVQVWDGDIGADGPFSVFTEPAGPMDWLTAEDLDFYIARFQERGFRGPLNWYRNMDRNWAQMAPYQGATVRQPSLFIVGERDLIFTMYHGFIDTMPQILPDLRGAKVIPGAGHWVQQEAAEESSKLLIGFLKDVCAGGGGA